VVVLVFLAGLVVLFTALRLVGSDGNRYTACALALTPYGVVGAAVAGVVGLALGQWWPAGVLLASTAVLAAAVAPRAIRAAAPREEVGAGRRLRVLSSNLYQDSGDVKTVVELVREHEIDVLSLLELTAAAAEEFQRAGLFDLLPHHVLDPVGHGEGSGLASRYPLTTLDLAGTSRFAQPSGRFDVAGVEVEMVAVHPVPPTDSAPVWQTELAALPKPDPAGAVRVLAGDFNATADHGSFRRLLRAGYVDAGQQRGAGLVPTWPSRSFPPPVTLDHILVDARATVADYRVLPVPGSDHRAVYAELVLPVRPV
jgi:endonuclease/exonuclease/phosphatase (EEP) superfamily protein YafD